MVITHYQQPKQAAATTGKANAPVAAVYLMRT
jgi:hypothetical protein